MKPENYLAIFCIIIGAIATYYAGVAIQVGAGYSAKVVCSGTFTANRNFDIVVDEEVGFTKAIYTITKNQNSVSVTSLFGLIDRVANYNPVRNSCTLAAPGEDKTIWDTVPKQSPPVVSSSNDNNWPNGDDNAFVASHPSINKKELDKLMDAAFHEPVLSEASIFRRTKALLVLYDGKIIAERYSAGISSSTPLLGWSMTKSLLSLLVGSRIQEEKLSLNQNNLLLEWSNDHRKEITIDQLLRASSGLEFKETNDVFSDTSRMLFLSNGTVEYASQRPLVHNPDTVWSYSSGTTNILSQILRDSFDDDSQYWNYPNQFYSKIGIKSLVMDTDNTGTFIGSSFSYATGRDWARIGLFAQQKGNWMGQQILPKSWFDYALTPTPTAPLGQYGAQWWLNAGSKDDSSKRYFPSLPSDAFFALGYQGQSISVIPSKNVVVVRLGATSPPDAWNLEGFLNYLLQHVITA